MTTMTYNIEDAHSLIENIHPHIYIELLLYHFKNPQEIGNHVF